MKAVNLIRYSTILDFLEVGPLDIDSIVENLEGRYQEKQVLSTLNRMEEKEYIKIDREKKLVTKQKDPFYSPEG